MYNLNFYWLYFNSACFNYRSNEYKRKRAYSSIKSNQNAEHVSDK